MYVQARSAHARTITYFPEDVVCLCSVRLSLLLQLLRLAPSRRMTMIIHVLMVFSILSSIATFFAQALVCLLWKLFELNSTYTGRCHEYWSMTFITSGINVVMDFLTWLAPFSLIYQIKISRGQKAGLYGVFAVGAMYVACPHQ